MNPINYLQNFDNNPINTLQNNLAGNLRNQSNAFNLQQAKQGAEQQANYDLLKKQALETGDYSQLNQKDQQAFMQTQAMKQSAENQAQYDLLKQQALKTGDYSKLNQQDQQAFIKTQAMKQELVDKDAGRTAFGILRALKAGDSEAAKSIIANNADDINALGDQMFNVDSASQLVDADPEQLARMSQGIIQLTGFDAGILKPMTEYQSIQTDLRKAESEERKLDRQIKRETNEIKRDELKSQISQAKTKTEQLKKTDSTRIDNAVVEAKGKKATINELLANQNYIDSLTGYTGRIPANLTDAGVEAEGILDNIKNSMTIENLSVMSGPLTDKDIQVIASASSRLKAGMSEKALRKELDRINGAYDRVIKNYGKEANRKGYKKQNEEAVKNESAALSDEDLLKKYGG